MKIKFRPYSHLGQNLKRECAPKTFFGWERKVSLSQNIKNTFRRRHATQHNGWMPQLNIYVILSATILLVFGVSWCSMCRAIHVEQRLNFVSALANRLRPAKPSIQWSFTTFAPILCALTDGPRFRSKGLVIKMTTSNKPPQIKRCYDLCSNDIIYEYFLKYLNAGIEPFDNVGIYDSPPNVNLPDHNWPKIYKLKTNCAWS